MAWTGQRSMPELEPTDMHHDQDGGDRREHAPSHGSGAPTKVRRGGQEGQPQPAAILWEAIWSTPWSPPPGVHEGAPSLEISYAI